MSNQTFRGGAKVGWVGASWPFGSLTVAQDRLTLKSLNAYSFAPSEVVALESYSSIPLLANGIRIRHNRADYPETMVFLCLGSRKSVLDSIARTGFLPKGIAAARAAGLPIRWSAIILFIVVWNVLFFMDESVGSAPTNLPGPLGVLAFFLAFALSTAARFLPAAQHLVLTEGHQFGEVKEFFALMQIVTGGLFAGFAIALLAFAGAH
jgi:hypothetical protein